MLLQSEMRGFLRQSVEESFSLKVDLHHQSVVRSSTLKPFDSKKPMALAKAGAEFKRKPPSYPQVVRLCSTV
jgi:hypothetical protein